MDKDDIEKMAREIVKKCLNNKNLGGLSAINTDNSNKESKCFEEFDKSLAAVMEHSMIRPDATPQMVRQFCDEAVKYKFRNVSLAPCFVDMAAQLLKGTGVKVSTAVSFPMGISSTKIKTEEALEVIENGAAEIDLPVNVGMIKAGEYGKVKEEIEEVVNAVNGKAIIKIVVDLGALTENERIKVALLGKMAGADYLKIAAGSKPGGVTVEDIKLMRQVVGNKIGIKADGGIKDYKTALSIVEAGATTIGASGSVKIVTKA